MGENKKGTLLNQKIEQLNKDSVSMKEVVIEHLPAIKENLHSKEISNQMIDELNDIYDKDKISRVLDSNDEFDLDRFKGKIISRNEEISAEEVDMIFDKVYHSKDVDYKATLEDIISVSDNNLLIINGEAKKAVSDIEDEQKSKEERTYPNANNALTYMVDFNGAVEDPTNSVINQKYKENQLIIKVFNLEEGIDNGDENELDDKMKLVNGSAKDRLEILTAVVVELNDNEVSINDDYIAEVSSDAILSQEEELSSRFETLKNNKDNMSNEEYLESLEELKESVELFKSELQGISETINELDGDSNIASLSEIQDVIEYEFERSESFSDFEIELNSEIESAKELVNENSNEEADINIDDDNDDFNHSM